MSITLQGTDIVNAIRRAGQALVAQTDYLTSLDQAIGDGDMGITMGKIGAALIEFVDATAVDDIGKYLYQLGTVVNKTAPSTMGTLTAGALMSAGKAMRNKTELEAGDLAAILQAADEGIQSRGKAAPGDKTIVDALHPASEAYATAIQSGASMGKAAEAAIEAAEAGRDRVTPLRSKVGRAGWVGERTEGKVDPGCAMFVLVLKALADR
jgi:phosphoenolpyruvate---glycerone phosphotransferase subunit DhaL